MSMSNKTHWSLQPAQVQFDLVLGHTNCVTCGNSSQIMNLEGFRSLRNLQLDVDGSDMLVRHENITKARLDDNIFAAVHGADQYGPAVFKGEDVLDPKAKSGLILRHISFLPALRG